MNKDYLKFLKTTKKFYKNINWLNKKKILEIRNAYLLVKDYTSYSLTDHFFKKHKLLYTMGLQILGKSLRLNSYDYWVLRGWSLEIAKRKVFEHQSNVTKKGISRLGCSTSSKTYLKQQNKTEIEIDEIMKSRKRFSFTDLDPEIHLAISRKGSKRRNEQIQELKKSNPIKLREQFNTTIDYYLSRGYSEEESKILLKNRQTTFSLKKVIDKFGRDKGTTFWQERQVKWQNTLSLKSPEEQKEINLKKAVNLKNLILKYGEKLGEQKYIEIMSNRRAPGSKEADIFFRKLLSNISLDEEPYWSKGKTGNEYFLYNANIKKFYFYDFVLKNKKIIIEYHGESFHPRKNILTEEQWKKWKVPFTNERADSKYAFDQQKKRFAESNGFIVIEIWSGDEFEKSLKKIVKYLL